MEAAEVARGALQLGRLQAIGNAVARRAALFVFMLAVPLVRGLVPPEMGSTYNSLLWHVEYFAAGFLLADFYILDWRESSQP